MPFEPTRSLICSVLLLSYISIYAAVFIAAALLLRALGGPRIHAASRVFLWRMLFSALVCMLLFANRYNYHWAYSALVSNMPQLVSPFSLDLIPEGVFSESGQVCGYTGAIYLQLRCFGRILCGFDATILIRVLGWSWAAGFALFWSFHLVPYYRLRTKLRKVPISGDAYISQLVHSERAYLNLSFDMPVKMLPFGTDTPYTVGFFRPVIVLHSEVWEMLNADEREAVIAHELWHIARHDNLRNLALLALQSILWFHIPLYIAMKAARRDLECLRDAQIVLVLRDKGKEQAYAKAIFSVAEACVGQYTGALHSGMLNGSGLGFRLSLLTRKSPSKALSILIPVFLAVILILCIFCAAYFPNLQPAPPMQF